MANSYAINPVAPHILPIFITTPGASDVFLIGSAIFLVFLLFCLGTLYFRLHALPEHLAHGNASKLQFEVIAVLALIALFTHNSWFWIAALLLALVPIPDLHAPLATMAGALSRIAGWRKPMLAAEATADQVAAGKPLLDPSPMVVVEPPSDAESHLASGEGTKS